MAELATISQVRSELGIVGNDQDAVISRKLEAAEQWLREVCDRPNGFVTQSVTETFDGEGGDEIPLSYRPVAASPAPVVTINGNTLAATSYTIKNQSTLAFITPGYAVGSTRNYESRAVTGVPFRSPSFGYDRNQVSVTYTGGYAADAIPANLTEAAIALACQLYRDGGRDFGLQSENLGSYSYTLSANKDRFSHIIAMITNHVGGSVV